MLDGMWHVARADGTYLGRFETAVGADIIYFDEKTFDMLVTGDVLDMDETHSAKKWRIRLTVPEKNRYGSGFFFEKIGDREKPIEVPLSRRKTQIVIVSHPR